MDGVSGTTNSLLNMGTALSDTRVKNEMSVSTFKKGLEAQAQTAMALIETVNGQSNGGQTGQLVDLLA